jgi:hypothetical protein
MPYRIAGIDVHKKMLAVVVSNVEVESEFQFERRMFGGNPEQLRSLAAWLLEPTPQTRLPSRTTKFATRYLGRKVIFDPARHTQKNGRRS